MAASKSFNLEKSLTDLENLVDGNLRHEYDFRSIYATVLQDWFGLDAAVVASVLGQDFEKLPLISDPATSTPLEPTPIAETFALHQNYPNPFNPETNITYDLSQPGRVRLRIYDVQGRLVQTLIDGAQPAGQHTLRFDASHLPSGTYLYRLETAGQVQTRKMALIR